MNRALFAFVLRRHRFGYVACWIVPILVSVIVGFIYPTYAKEREAVSRMLKIFDKFFTDGVVDFLSPIGFLLLPFQHPLTLLMLAITAAVAPIALPAQDRGRGLLDMLLATPLSRRALARTVMGASVLAGAAFGWAPFLGTWIAAQLSGHAHEIPFDQCALVALNASALVIALAAAALFCSVTADDGGAATARFVGFVVVTLALDLVSRFWKDGRWLKWTSLLGYYHPHDLVAGRIHPALPFAVLLGFAAVTYAAAEWVLVTRRRA